MSGPYHVPPAGYPASHGMHGHQAPAGPQFGMHAPAADAYYPQAPQPGLGGYPAQQQQYQQPQHHQQYQQHHQYAQQPQQYAQQPQQYQQQQYQQPQQHGGNNRVEVVSPQFCMPQQTVLVMQEHAGYKSDDFTITDATGRPFFKLSAALFSIGNKRQLLDAYGSPLLHMERKMLSLHNTWLLVRPSDGAKVAELKPSMMSLTPSIKVYLNDGDKEPDFIIKGDFRSKSFSIYQRTRGSDVPIAQVQRESRFASSTSFLMSMVTDAQKYFITIEPSVDAAFVVALATLCDEIYNDKE